MVCIGASQVWGPPVEDNQPLDYSSALAALRAVVPRGARVVYGEGIWSSPPTATAVAPLAGRLDELVSLAELIDLAVAEGFVPVAVHEASIDEWDQFESGFSAGYARWLAAHDPDHPDARRGARPGRPAASRLLRRLPRRHGHGLPRPARRLDPLSRDGPSPVAPEAESSAPSPGPSAAGPHRLSNMSRYGLPPAHAALALTIRRREPSGFGGGEYGGKNCPGDDPVTLARWVEPVDGEQTDVRCELCCDFVDRRHACALVQSSLRLRRA